MPGALSAACGECSRQLPAPLYSMSIRNQKTVHTVSAAGAHSKDGQFTARNLGEASGKCKVTKAPQVVETGIPGLNATLRASETKDTAILAISSTASAASLLPDELEEQSKQRWLEDHETLISIHTDLEIGEDWRTMDETIDIPTPGGEASLREIAETAKHSKQADWMGHLEGVLAETVAKDGFHGYRTGDDPQLLPENTPFTVNGDAAELTGHQRATALAIFREHEGTFFTATSSFYGRAYAEWIDKTGRPNTTSIAPDGSIERAEIAPVGWDTKPWLRPVLNNEPKHLAMMERYAHTREALG